MRPQLAPLRHDRTEELFGPVIHSYTRAQAMADGVLVDVTNATDASGRKLSPFKFPVALTRAAYAATIEVGGKFVELFLRRHCGPRDSVQKGSGKEGTALSALPPHWDRNPDQNYDFNSAQTRHFLRRHCGT